MDNGRISKIVCSQCATAMHLVSVCWSPGGSQNFQYECFDCGHSVVEMRSIGVSLSSIEMREEK